MNELTRSPVGRRKKRPSLAGPGLIGPVTLLESYAKSVVVCNINTSHRRNEMEGNRVTGQRVSDRIHSYSQASFLIAVSEQQQQQAGSSSSSLVTFCTKIQSCQISFLKKIIKQIHGTLRIDLETFPFNLFFLSFSSCFISLLHVFVGWVDSYLVFIRSRHPLSSIGLYPLATTTSQLSIHEKQTANETTLSSSSLVSLPVKSGQAKSCLFLSCLFLELR